MENVVNNRRPQVGQTVELLHRTEFNARTGNVKLARCKGKPEVTKVTAVYMEPNRVRVASGEFWDVIPCKNSTANWQTVGIGGRVE